MKPHIAPTLSPMDGRTELGEEVDYRDAVHHLRRKIINNKVFSVSAQLNSKYEYRNKCSNLSLNL